MHVCLVFGLARASSGQLLVELEDGVGVVGYWSGRLTCGLLHLEPWKCMRFKDESCPGRYRWIFIQIFPAMVFKNFYKLIIIY